MIELPHGLLNTLFMILLVYANMTRSRRRPHAEQGLAPQPVGFRPLGRRGPTAPLGAARDMSLWRPAPCPA